MGAKESKGDATISKSAAKAAIEEQKKLVQFQQKKDEAMQRSQQQKLNPQRTVEFNDTAMQERKRLADEAVKQAQFARIMA